MVNKKIILFIVIFLSVISLIIIISFSIFNNKNTNKVVDTSLSNPYTDPGTGEVIYNQPDRVPEGEASIIYLGFTKLINNGLTSIQFNNLKTSIEDFSKTKNINITEISIQLSSISQTVNQTTGEKNISFITTINRKDLYNFQLTYSGIKDINVLIYNYSNQLIYSKKTN